MKKIRCRMMTFDTEGNLVRDEFPEILDTSTQWNMVDKKKAFKDMENGKVVFIFITTNLNTEPEEVSDRYIVDPYRIYVYKINVKDKRIDLEYKEDNGNFISRMSLRKKLKHSRVFYSYDNDCNTPYMQYGDDEAAMVDNIYVVSDHSRIKDISDMLKLVITTEIRALENKTNALYDMLDSTNEVMYKVIPHDILLIEEEDKNND